VGVISASPIGLEDRSITTIAPRRPGNKSRPGSRNKRIDKLNKQTPIENISPIETCEAETRLIGDYLSDNLDATDRQAFEGHLKACPECAAFLATYKKTIALTRSFLSLSAPKKLTLRLPCAGRH